MISLPQQMKKWKNVSMLSWTYSKVKPTYKTDEDWPQIVGKGFIPPNSKIPPFLKIQDVPTFYMPLGKTEVLNESFNQFVYTFYPQSILILEEHLLKWSNANLI